MRQTACLLLIFAVTRTFALSIDTGQIEPRQESTTVFVDTKESPRTTAVGSQHAIRFDSSWDGGSTVRVSVNGEVLTNTTSAAAGKLLWSPEAAGTYDFEHFDGNTTLTASFIVKAGVGVELVTARQRYPWNGLVDIAFTVNGDADKYYAVSFVATNVSACTGLTMNTLLDEKGATLTSNAVKPGTYRWAWNAAADLPDGFKCDRVTVTAMAEEHLGGVQLWEGGPYWAECNVGATKPEEYGYYFWWGDTVGYKRDGSSWSAVDGSRTGFSFSMANCPTSEKSNSQLESMGYIDSTGNLVAAHDAATAHLGGSWRIPTMEEMDALISNCTREWAMIGGVKGWFVSGKGEYASKRIFLPAAGYGTGSSYSEAGSVGSYSTSKPHPGGGGYYYAMILYLSSQNFDRRYEFRHNGRTIRPVRDPRK